MIQKVKNIDEMARLTAVPDKEDFEQYFPGSKAEVMQVFIDHLHDPEFAVWYDPGGDGKIDFYLMAIDAQRYPVNDGVAIIYVYSRDSIFNHRDALIALKAWSKERGAEKIRLTCHPKYEQLYGSFGFMKSEIIMEQSV